MAGGAVAHRVVLRDTTNARPALKPAPQAAAGQGEHKTETPATLPLERRPKIHAVSPKSCDRVEPALAGGQAQLSLHGRCPPSALALSRAELPFHTCTHVNCLSVEVLVLAG